MTTGFRAAGDFCWVNIMSPEPAKACEFFSALLGWTTPAMPGMGFSVQVGGKNIGGLFDVVSPQTPNGMAPVIGIMVKVDDANAAAEKVRSLGGKAKDPMDIGDVGRMVVCHDPNGAEFDVWQPGKLRGTDVDSMAHGAPSWFETLTSDLAGVTPFYEKLFGWNVEAMPMPPGVSYSYIKLGDDAIGGMMQLTPDMKGIPSHWGVYFAVKNIDEAAAKVPTLGGSLCMPVLPIPGVGRFCGVLSPQGVRFQLIEYAAK